MLITKKGIKTDNNIVIYYRKYLKKFSQKKIRKLNYKGIEL